MCWFTLAVTTQNFRPGARPGDLLKRWAQGANKRGVECPRGLRSLAVIGLVPVWRASDRETYRLVRDPFEFSCVTLTTLRAQDDRALSTDAVDVGWLLLNADRSPFKLKRGLASCADPSERVEPVRRRTRRA